MRAAPIAAALGRFICPTNCMAKLKAFSDSMIANRREPHFRSRLHGNVHWRATSNSFTPTQMASLYNYPAGTGQGECIGIIELGGGYRPTDLQTYFSGLGVPLPKVSAVSVDHGKNQPTGDSNGPDGEVMLDIEVAGAIAPAAQIAYISRPIRIRGFSTRLLRRFMTRPTSLP